MSDFVRLDGLWLEGRLEAARRRRAIEQLSAEPRRAGWFSGRRARLRARAGSGSSIRRLSRSRGDGRVRLATLPGDRAPTETSTWASPRRTRCCSSFGGEDLSAHLDDPLYAVAPPKWYTRDTRALGRLVESSPEAIQPEYWPLVAALRPVARKLRAMRCWPSATAAIDFQGRVFDEYGMLNFGDAIHKTDRRIQAAGLRRALGDRVLRFPARAVPALLPHGRS